MATGNLTPEQERFAAALAQRTSLELLTARTWVQAENGPPDNPLGIQRGGKLARYGSAPAALEATVALLRTPTYAPLLKTARDPRSNADAELAAISSSPWNSSKRADQATYAGLLTRSLYYLNPPGPAAGPSLLGRVADGVLGAPAAVAGAVAGATGAAANKAEEIASAPVRAATGWAERTAGKALVYVALTTVAVALVLLGTGRAIGLGPRQALALTRRPATDDIPF